MVRVVRLDPLLPQREDLVVQFLNLDRLKRFLLLRLGDQSLDVVILILDLLELGFVDVLKGPDSLERGLLQLPLLLLELILYSLPRILLHLLKLLPEPRAALLNALDLALLQE